MMKNENSLRSKWKRYGTLAPFLIPAMVIAFVFAYVPMAGIILAFKDNPNIDRWGVIEALGRVDWTLDNFAQLFKSGDFMKILGNTLIISALKIAVLFPLPIIFSLLFTEIKNKFASKTMQALMYLPYLISWAMATGIFKNIFNADNGLVNAVLQKLGIISKPLKWYNNSDRFLFLVLFTGGWKDVGWSMIVYIAAILSIDSSYFEAARIDGATKLQQIFKITLPLIKGAIISMFILRICYLLDAGFDQIYTMIDKTALMDDWDIIGTYVYRNGIQSNSGNYSFTTAVGLLNSVAALVILVIGNFSVKKISGEGIW